MDATADRQYVGSSVAGVGDVDLDGAPDFAVGVPGAAPGGRRYAGSVLVYSGADGSLLLRLDGGPRTFGLGVDVGSAGDFDGDGHADIVAGAHESSPPTGGTNQDKGVVRVFSGASGAVLFEAYGSRHDGRLGTRVASGADLNGDGRIDVAASAPGGFGNPGFRGYVYAFCGATGAVLYEIQGTVGGMGLGQSLALVDDVDGDGVRELLTGSDHAQKPGTGWITGTAMLFSGATGALLRADYGEQDGARFGAAVGEAGDWDRDGTGDYLVGSPGQSGAHYESGVVFVVSGATGTELLRIDGALPTEQFGIAVARLSDLDADGFDDYVVGSLSPGQTIRCLGAVTVCSGATGELLARHSARCPEHRLGVAVANVGDQDGDGIPEVGVGAPWSEPGGLTIAGSAKLLKLEPYLTLSESELPAAAGARVRADLDFPISEAGMRYAMLASAHGSGRALVGQVEVPLTPDLLFWRMRGGWTPPNVPQAHGTLDPAGDATVPIHGAPALTVYVGRTVWVSALSYDPAAPTPRLSSIARTLTVVP